MSEGDAIWNDGYLAGKKVKIKKLEAKNKRLREAIEEALSIMKDEWNKINNHPASRWAKDIKCFEQILEETKQ